MSNSDCTDVDCGQVQSERFYSGAIRRITLLMPVIAVLSIITTLLRFGPLFSAGLALGCGIAFLNFRWLKHAVIALAARVTMSGKPQSSSGIVLRFLVRYALIIAGCYAIFRVSVTALYGLLAGLFLPVAAIACEAAYELYAALCKDV